MCLWKLSLRNWVSFAYIGNDFFVSFLRSLVNRFSVWKGWGVNLAYTTSLTLLKLSWVRNFTSLGLHSLCDTLVSWSSSCARLFIYNITSIIFIVLAVVFQLFSLFWVGEWRFGARIQWQYRSYECFCLTLCLMSWVPQNKATIACV